MEFGEFAAMRLEKFLRILGIAGKKNTPEGFQPMES
jgi:hypothetical protein